MFFRSPSWDSVDYLALDLETSGLDARRHQILSVGMVPIRQGAIRWGEHDYTLVRPLSMEELDGEAIGIHQIFPEELRAAPLLEEVMELVATRLEKAVLLVHHAPLDVEFLRRSFERLGRRWPKAPVVDTRVLASRVEQRLQQLDPYARELPRGLEELRRVFDLPPFDPHHALADALATAELFLALRARLGARTLRQVRSQ